MRILQTVDQQVQILHIFSFLLWTPSSSCPMRGLVQGRAQLFYSTLACDMGMCVTQSISQSSYTSIICVSTYHPLEFPLPSVTGFIALKTLVHMNVWATQIHLYRQIMMTWTYTPFDHTPIHKPKCKLVSILETIFFPVPPLRIY